MKNCHFNHVHVSLLAGKRALIFFISLLYTSAVCASTAVTCASSARIKIGSFRQEIQWHQQVIDTTLARLNSREGPLRDAWKAAVETGKVKGNTLIRAQEALNQSVEQIRGIMAMDTALTEILDQIRSSLEIGGDRSLADQLRYLSQSSEMPNSARATLIQLSHAVGLVEANAKDLGINQAELIRNHLESGARLTDAILNMMQQMSQEISSSVRQLELDQKTNFDRLAEAQAQAGILEDLIEQHRAAIVKAKESIALVKEDLEQYPILRHGERLGTYLCP
jgi:hypothetical protein